MCSLFMPSKLLQVGLICNRGSRSCLQQISNNGLWKRTYLTDSKTEKKYDEDVLLTSEKDGVMTLTLNRPNRRNALNLSLLQELKAHLSKVNSDDSINNIRAVVIQANGPTFCSGHDLKELLSNNSQSEKEDGDDNVQLFRLCSEVMTLCRSIPQPTISAVHGMATAAGCQLAASTDLTIASPKASFATPGVHNIGLFCSTPAVPLIRTIPQKVALDMLFTGRVLHAHEALTFGLVSRISSSNNDDKEAVQREANAIAQQIASKSGHAMRIGKRALYQQADLTSLEEAYNIASDAMIEGMKSEDARCGIHSFLTKETAEWKHR